MYNANRREMLKYSAATSAVLAMPQVGPISSVGHAKEPASDSLATQLYKSMSDKQKNKICLPADHPSRQFISNWWYVHPEHRLHNTFNDDQRKLIQEIFDALHSSEHQAAVNQQVKIDQYNEVKNTPSVGFFGTPEDQDFEFVYTGHHVTRRCNAHSQRGQGFGGAPIFYGHFPEEFNETKDHPGNPYWYQGLVFNKFVQALDGKQQAKALDPSQPRSEKPSFVITMKDKDLPGLSCAELSVDQKQLLLETMTNMLAMFREDDVAITIDSIKQRNMIEQLHVSYYGGKFDIGSDKVWDTWQIEGPEMVWYFRGQPHIHSYFHLKSPPA